jgi:hypothetical protein
MFKRVLDVSVSVATVAAAIAIVWAVVTDNGRRHWPWRTREVGQPTGYVRGDKMSVLPGVDFSASNRTVVVVFSSRCSFCIESAPHFRRLVSARNERHARVRVVAVGSEQDPGARQFPEQQGWHPDQIVVVPPAAVRVAGTPAILLVDSKGLVEASWLGRMAPDTFDAIVRTAFE